MSTPCPVSLDDLELRFANDACKQLSARLEELKSAIAKEFPQAWVPSELSGALGRIGALRRCLVRQRRDDQNLPCEMETDQAPLLRLAIEEHVERLTQAKEESARRTNLDEPQLALEAQIKVGMAMIERSPLAGVLRLPEFTLAAYLNIETVTRMLGDAASPPKRVFDEKFHILTSQALFSTASNVGCRGRGRGRQASASAPWRPGLSLPATPTPTSKQWNVMGAALTQAARDGAHRVTGCARSESWIGSRR